MTDDFRITFFYGPDNVPDRPDAVVCVFNVKKRSWKGGVQVIVELAQAQLEQLRERGLLGELTEMIRAKVEAETFDEYEQRARDLFTQQICRAKLDLAIANGIRQENQTIAAEVLREELTRAVAANADEIRQAILTELDV
ncbi:MAG TPA: hypothetical protein VF879_05105 [Nitrospirales bacterium]